MTEPQIRNYLLEKIPPINNRTTHEESYDPIFPNRHEVRDSINIRNSNLHLDNWFLKLGWSVDFIRYHHLDHKICNRNRSDKKEYRDFLSFLWISFQEERTKFKKKEQSSKSSKR